MLYFKLLKALYGTLKAARLFWEKLTTKLPEWGFVANPYNPCVMDKVIDNKQCTVTWHVDDLKISHINMATVDDIINRMEAEFGKYVLLSKSSGKVHDYLGMVLDYWIPGQAVIKMEDYT